MAAEEFGGAVTAKGELFTHKVLWRTAKVQIESAIASEQGSFYCALAGMVFAFHAIEAYLNFLGERLAPDVWQDERNFFRKEPYRGLMAKSVRYWSFALWKSLIGGAVRTVRFGN